MSYNIHLYKKEVRKSYELNHSNDFFENENNISRFSSAEKEKIKTQFLNYKYKVVSEKEGQIEFELREESVLLTDNCVYFSAPFGDAVFDMCLTTAELGYELDLAVFDPQNGGWQNNDF